MSSDGTRITVRIRRVVNLGDFNNIEYMMGVEEDVPPGKKTSEHFNDVINHLEKLMAKKLLENSQIELED